MRKAVLTLQVARALAERDKWQCATCAAPSEKSDDYCLHCRMYWDDVRNGLFDEDRP